MSVTGARAVGGESSAGSPGTGKASSSRSHRELPYLLKRSPGPLSTVFDRRQARQRFRAGARSSVVARKNSSETTRQRVVSNFTQTRDVLAGADKHQGWSTRSTGRVRRWSCGIWSTSTRTPRLVSKPTQLAMAGELRLPFDAAFGLAPGRRDAERPPPRRQITG